MQTFSKYFTLDTIDTNQTLKPIIVIADSDNNVLFALSQDQDEIFNNNGDSIDIINCIDKVSNVKTSNDFDTKKLKINRLRCILYNYYDVNTKLSQYIDNGIISKNLYLFYKSPTTNIINLSDTPTDYDCALGYAGEISRMKFNDTKINITAEDITQIKISGKQIPYMSIEKAPEAIREFVIERYDQEGVVIPITFGYVDKAPLFPTLSDGLMTMYIDNQPVGGVYKTAKIPALLDNATSDFAGFVYIKIGDEWVIKGYNYLEEGDAATLNQLYPNIGFTTSTNATESALLNFAVPELHSTAYSEFAIFEHHRTVAQALYFPYGALEYTLDANVDEASLDFTTEAINDNGGAIEGHWYREFDTIESGYENFIAGSPPPYTGTKNKTIIMRLSKGVSAPLAGVTTFACIWRTYQ